MLNECCSHDCATLYNKEFAFRYIFKAGKIQGDKSFIPKKELIRIYNGEELEVKELRYV